jgi:hypothetical protein
MRESHSKRANDRASGSIAARTLRAVVCIALAGTTGVALCLGTAGLVLADELPLVLTNDNIGMSSEEIDEIQGPDDYKDIDPDGPKALPGEDKGGVLTLTAKDLDSAPRTGVVLLPDSEFVSAETDDATAVIEPAKDDAKPAPVGAAVAASASTTTSDDACPAVAAQAGIASFEQCVEKAIRGGNGYSESSSVCRSIFPSGAEPTS